MEKSMLYNISPSEIYKIKTVCSYILMLCYLLEQVQTEWLWASESQPPVCTENYVLNINRNNTVPQQQPVKEKKKSRNNRSEIWGWRLHDCEHPELEAEHDNYVDLIIGWKAILLCYELI